MKKQNPQSFEFGESQTQNELDFDAPVSGGSISGNAPTDHVGESGSIPTPPLQDSSIKRAINACDFEHNSARVPDHPYSSICDCERCLPQHETNKHDKLEFPPIPDVVYQTYTAKQLNFRTIGQSDARAFILPRNYLRRWFVGCIMSFGAFTPDNQLVAACVISSPGAYSNRFTSKNTVEVRRFVMLDCCGKNSESKFIAWILRWIHKHLTHIRYVLTFGDPVFDKETPYKAAGFVLDGTSDCSAQWISHKGRKSREAPRMKHRYVYTFVNS